MKNVIDIKEGTFILTACRDYIDNSERMLNNIANKVDLKEDNFENILEIIAGDIKILKDIINNAPVKMHIKTLEYLLTNIDNCILTISQISSSKFVHKHTSAFHDETVTLLNFCYFETEEK